jgi:hypothetical protein
MTGEISTTLTGSRGLEISTSLLIVVAVGLMELLVQLLIELILLEIELGQILLCHLKSLSTAKLEEAATEETQERFTPMLTKTVFQKKLAKHMLPKIPISSAVQTFKNAKTAHHHPELNPETKETVGLSQNIQFGKLLNTVEFQALTK